MIHGILHNPLKRDGLRFTDISLRTQLIALGSRFGAGILRALILLVVALLVVFVGLMLATGHYEAGAPVIGSLLLIGLGASHSARL